MRPAQPVVCDVSDQHKGKVVDSTMTHRDLEANPTRTVDIGARMCVARPHNIEEFTELRALPKSALFWP